MRHLKLVVFLSALIALGLAGCGGGGNEGTPVPGNAILSMEFVWPEPTRVIPVNADSITARLKQGATTVETKSVTKPADNAADRKASLAFAPQLEGDYVVEVEAKNGTRLLAKGSSDVRLIGGETTKFVVVLDSEVKSFRVVFSVNGSSIGTKVVTKNATGDFVSDIKVPVGGVVTFSAEPRPSVDGSGLTMPLDNAAGPREVLVSTRDGVNVENQAHAGQAVTGRLVSNGSGSSGDLILTYRETGDTFTFKVGVNSVGVTFGNPVNPANVTLSDVDALSERALGRIVGSDKVVLDINNRNTDFDMEYDGNTVTINLPQATEQDLIDELQSELESIGALNGKVTVDDNGDADDETFGLVFNSQVDVAIVGEIGEGTTAELKELANNNVELRRASGALSKTVLLEKVDNFAIGNLRPEHDQDLTFPGASTRLNNNLILRVGTKITVQRTSNSFGKKTHGVDLFDIAGQGSAGFASTSGAVRNLTYSNNPNNTAVGNTNFTGLVQAGPLAVAASKSSLSGSSKDFVWVLDSVGVRAYEKTGATAVGSATNVNVSNVIDIAGCDKYVLVLTSTKIEVFSGDGSRKLGEVNHGVGNPIAVSVAANGASGLVCSASSIKSFTIAN